MGTTCEFCNITITEKWASGRFCSKKCSSKFSSRKVDQGKRLRRVAEIRSIKSLEKRSGLICEKCGVVFTAKKYMRKDRKVHCESCLRKWCSTTTPPESILSISKRTTHKILKRAGVACSICHWSEASCDLHHIEAKAKGGSDLNDNLVVVCPNCHRVIHTTDKYSYEFLKTISVDKVFPDWNNYYNVIARGDYEQNEEEPSKDNSSWTPLGEKEE